MTMTLSDIPDLQAGIIVEAILERNRQDEKWGVRNHRPNDWTAILAEEVGEVAKAGLEVYPVNQRLISVDQALKEWRDELVHVMATAMAAIEYYDRELGGKNGSERVLGEVETG